MARSKVINYSLQLQEVDWAAPLQPKVSKAIHPPMPAGHYVDIGAAVFIPLSGVGPEIQYLNQFNEAAFFNAKQYNGYGLYNVTRRGYIVFATPTRMCLCVCANTEENRLLLSRAGYMYVGGSVLPPLPDLRKYRPKLKYLHGQLKALLSDGEYNLTIQYGLVD